jgi:predicted Rossmann fold nucleotide-binding protein DprA/Smf involved in DNA uptake
VGAEGARMKQKVGVVGNQEGWQYATIKRTLKKLDIDSDATIISGGADGVDTYAQMYARETGCTIIIHYPDPKIPSPERYFARNKQIAEECDLLIAFDKKSGSAGTKNTVAYAKKANKPIFLFRSEQEVEKLVSNELASSNFVNVKTLRSKQESG